MYPPDGEEGGSVLIFGFTKRSAEDLCRWLTGKHEEREKMDAKLEDDSEESALARETLARRITEACEGSETFKKDSPLDVLRRAARHGLGYHHAGLPRKLRRLVETAVREGYIRCLAFTSTLAYRIYLSAERVILRRVAEWSIP